jgi:hypothetical protein
VKKILLLTLFALYALTGLAQTPAMATADNWFAKKSYANAASAYLSVLSSDSTNVKALRRMGFCIMNLPGDEFEAAGYFYRALHADPKDPIANYYLGVVYMDKAKQESGKQNKAGFKAKAAEFLNKASMYGSAEAKAAINDLNGI